MNKSHIYWALVFIVGYFIGAKFPSIAHKTGLV